MTTATIGIIERRDFALEGSPNIRHMGGYATPHGRATSDGLVRAASLHRLKPGGIEVLRSHGVQTVVDLRSQVERERDVTPDLDPYGIRHVAAPVFEQDASPVGIGAEFPGYAAVYERFLEIGRDAYRCLFKTIAETEGGVLFHCAAGKDRTGVAAALLLAIAGVPDTTIVADYAVSAELLKPLLVEWLPRMQERGFTQEKAEKLMGSPAGDMEATLVHIRTRWGGAEGYMEAIGLTPGTIETVRGRVLA